MYHIFIGKPIMHISNENTKSNWFIYQSRISRIFGFPSEVTCNPAAAGSTPESEKWKHAD